MVLCCETWVLRKLDNKIVNAFDIKCCRKILRIPWIAHQLFNVKFTSSTSKLALYFCKTSTTKILWPRYSLQRFREDNNARNGSRGKEAEESQDKDGRKTSQIRLLRWQRQAEWRRTATILRRHLGSDVLTRITIALRREEYNSDKIYCPPPPHLLVCLAGLRPSPRKGQTQ